jgi:hypothetical protein
MTDREQSLWREGSSGPRNGEPLPRGEEMCYLPIDGVIIHIHIILRVCRCPDLDDQPFTCIIDRFYPFSGNQSSIVFHFFEAG